MLSKILVGGLFRDYIREYYRGYHGGYKIRILDNGPDGLFDETTDVKNVGSMYRCAFRH